MALHLLFIRLRGLPHPKTYVASQGLEALRASFLMLQEMQLYMNKTAWQKPIL